MMRFVKGPHLNTTIQTQIQNNDGFPEEIMHDIFSRLPVQTLSQCRFVSKDWFNLIKDPDFIKLHHSRQINYQNLGDMLFLCHINAKEEQLFYLVDNENNNPNSPAAKALKALNCHFSKPAGKRIKIVGIANGFMCLSLLPEDNRFFIYNPVTKEIIELPLAPGPICNDNNKLEYLYPTSSGFAFHASTNTYKIVRTWYFHEKDVDNILLTGFEVYTLGSTKWRRCLDDSSIHSNFEISLVFLHEAFHWEFDDLNTQPYMVRRIGAFNIGDEKFRTMGKPLMDHGIKTRTLSSLREYLCLTDEFKDRTVIWIMKQYGVAQSWTREHVIWKVGPYATLSFRAACTMKNGCVILYGGEYEGCFDLEKQEFKQIMIPGIQPPPCMVNGVVHITSLISPRSIATIVDPFASVTPGMPIKKFRPLRPCNYIIRQ